MRCLVVRLSSIGFLPLHHFSSFFFFFLDKTSVNILFGEYWQFALEYEELNIEMIDKEKKTKQKMMMMKAESIKMIFISCTIPFFFLRRLLSFTTYKDIILSSSFFFLLLMIYR